MKRLYASIARMFVENSQLSILLIVTIFALGLIAFIVTPKQYNPEISMPAYRIVTRFPGATAQEVEMLVTTEIERKIAEMPDIDSVFSQSLPEQSVVTVLFNVGSDLSKSTTAIQSKMYSNMDLAPMGVETPLIKQIDPENVPIITLAITSDTYAQEGLRLFAYDLRSALSEIQGVTDMQVIGGLTKQIRIEPDPERLSSRNVTTSDIVQALQANTQRSWAGLLEGNAVSLPIEVDGTISSAAQLKKLAVRGNSTQTVYLGDVADIVEGYETVERYVRFRTPDAPAENAVYLSIAKRKGANSVTVSHDVQKKLEELQTSLIPDDVTIRTVRDEGRTAREEINGLTFNIATSILIVSMLLIFFLRLRAALVVALAIPLTLSLVLAAGALSGQTINRITLFALILSLGLLVDNAIVVVENIYRHLTKRDEHIKESTVHAVAEVGGSLLLSTLTSVIVFLPMRAVTGMMGAYMGPIAFFVPAALLASFFVALTLSPYLATALLRRDDSDKEQKTQHMEVRYRMLIQYILDHRKVQNRILMATVLLAVLSFSFPLLQLIQFRMLPKADKEQFYVYIDAPAQTPLALTEQYAKSVEDVLLTDKQVTSVQTFVGTPPVMDFNGLFKGADARTQPYQATVKVNLRHPDDRWESSEHIVDRLRPSVKKALRLEPDVRTTLVEDPPGPPVLATLLARVKGPDDELREAIALDLYALLHSIDGPVDIDTTLSTGAPEKLVRIDHAKLGHSGLSVTQVIEALQIATQGIPVSTAHLDAPERTVILVRFPLDARNEPSDLQRITLRNQTGDMVSLGSVVEITDASAQPPIWHDEQERTTMVFAELSRRPVVYAVKDAIASLRHYTLPNGRGELVSWNLFGFTYRDTSSRQLYRIEWGGEFEMTLENFRDLGIAMLIAFLLVYALLVAQFRSFAVPLLVMSSIVLAMSGVILGFAVLNLFGIYFSATSMIGIIALGGIVVNNAIILLEFINEKRADGYTPKMAIIDAAQTRLRPILLTTLTTVLGSLTIAWDPVWSGLAWSIVFGLTFSTVLTLIIFPILYARVTCKPEDFVAT